jgi:hypothetical protein
MRGIAIAANLLHSFIAYQSLVLLPCLMSWEQNTNPKVEEGEKKKERGEGSHVAKKSRAELEN